MLWIAEQRITYTREETDAFRAAVEQFFADPAIRPNLAERPLAEALGTRAGLARALKDAGVSPGVQLKKRDSGAPFLPYHPGIRISMSHTEGAAFAAVSTDGPVGIDAERIREVPHAGQIAARYFGGETGEFLTIWTRKESYAKFLGDGLPAAIQINTATLEDTVCFRTEVRLGCIVTLCQKRM